MPRGSNSPPGPLTRALAAILSEAFIELLITQERFAALVGMSKSSMSRTLLGERVVDLEQLHRMCMVLGISVVEVIAAAERIATK